MKATIDKAGFIVVTPENSVEHFALQCWLERMNAPFGEQKSGVHIDLDADGARREPIVPLPTGAK